MPVNSKKFIFPLLAAVLACPARADVTYCMAKPILCTYDGTSFYWPNRVNFALPCYATSGADVAEIDFQFATMCATGGSASKTEFKTTSSLTFDTSNLENNKYCWCRIISPAFSTIWVSVAMAWTQHVSQYPSEKYTESRTNCIYGCAWACAAAMNNSKDFASKMTSSLE